MSDVNETINLAEKLAGAAPVESPAQNEAVNLASTYLSSATGDTKSDAFLTDNTMNSHISKVSELANESMQNAISAWLDTKAYDPQAEEKARAAAALAAEQAQKLAAQEKQKQENKEKLQQFLKWQSAADRKLWYSRWFLFWILFSICIVLAWVFMFNDETTKLVSSEFWLKDNSLLSAGVNLLNDKIQLTEDAQSNRFANIATFSTFWHIITENIITSISNDTEKTPTEFTEPTEPEINDEENTADEEESSTDEEENTTDEEENTTDEKENTTDEKENTTDEKESTTDEEESTTDEEESTTDKEEDIAVSITYTANINNANRVIASNCDKLSCGDYTKAENIDEIVLCSEFTKNVDLAPDAARVWRSGKCRYQDESELVLLEL